VFAGLDSIISRASALTSDPSSTLRKADFVSSVQNVFEDINGVFSMIDGLRDEANQKLYSSIERANSLMDQIASLNTEIQRYTLNGSDASGAETEQSQLLNELSELIDFKATPRDSGGVELRSNTGLLLVDHRAASLSMAQSDTGARFSGVSITPAGSDAELDITRQISGGEIRGLLTTRDYDLPELTYSLGEFASHLADSLNQAHNEGTAVPAPTSLTGRNTGLLGTDSLNFTGAATFAVVGSDGRTVESVQVDFDAGTMTNSGGTVTAIGTDIASFAAALDTSFGANASVSFTNGQLSMSATGTNGLAIAQDPTNPSDRAGRGVSAFFGLNDIVSSGSPLKYETGLQGTDAHGFTSGSLTFALRNGNGDVLQTIDYTPTPGATMDDIVNDLNSTAVLGSFATATLDADGRLKISPNSTGSTAIVDVVDDTTLRGTTGLSMSDMFGLGIEGPAERGRSISVKNDIALNSSRLATSAFDTTATAVGSLGVPTGGNGGALALQGALNGSVNMRTIQGADYLNLSITDAAAQVASQAGSRAETYETRAEAAFALRDEAQTRRASVEGVNLDEEMVNMTIYQQSYAAASRLIQASKDMFDVLLNMT
ncbi:MAG: flagellar biosynthesis protein FlgK, partial [Ponticaulis sp.]|nr:flagellar biosynthesis protein FlgK [Ponticaulis sp.]